MTDSNPNFISDDEMAALDSKSGASSSNPPAFISDDEMEKLDQQQNSPSASLPGFISDDEMEQLENKQKEKYSSPLQQLGAAAEGAAQGVVGPLATVAERGLSKLGVPGLSDEDIKGREENNPWTHGIGEATGFAGSLLTGVGEAPLAAKVASKILPESLPVLGKLGSQVVQAFMQNAAISGGNEINKAMLGQSDPDHAVSSALFNIGANGLIGGLLQGIPARLAGIETNLAPKAASFLSGMGASAQKIPLEALEATEKELGLLGKNLYDSAAFKLGHKAYESGINGLVNTAATGPALSVAGYVGSKVHPDAAMMAYPYIKKYVQKYITKPIEATGSLVVPTVTKWLSEGAGSKLLPLLDYASKVEKGNKLLNSSVDALFKEGNLSVTRYFDKQKERDKLDDWLQEGGIDNELKDAASEQNDFENYAEGGKVENEKKTNNILTDHPIATVYPEQNMMLQTAKGRISGYLNSLRPQPNQSKLAFDREPDQSVKKKSYNRALDIAAQPVSILNKTKNGTLDPEDVKHFNSLYPELNQVLQKRLTERITQAQLKGERPSYAVRQSLSLLVGAPLSSELQPLNIQAAQAVFAPKQAPNQPDQGQAPAKNKKSTATLSKSSQAFLTGNQARAERSQRQT